MAIWLGETTTLALAAPGKASLRTTVPMSIVKQFNLGPGDKLDWAFQVIDGQMAVVIRPIKG